MSKQNSRSLQDLIEKASCIILLTHSRPDADGISACAALDIILRKMGKQVEAIYPNSPEFAIKRQPANVSIGQHTLEPDLLIACDTANYERLYFPDSFSSIPLINLDHHISNSLKGVLNVVDHTASSACEVVFDLLMEWDEALIDASVAQALLFGILYDSRVFHTKSTTATTLRTAAQLIDKGADLFQLKVELLANKDPLIAKIWARLLERIEVDKKKKVLWTYVTQADLEQWGVTLSSVVGFSNFLSDIAMIDVTILLYETPEGKTKVSLRSREADVNAVAGMFGGGGHKHAAGIMSDQPLQELVKAIIQAL